MKRFQLVMIAAMTLGLAAFAHADDQICNKSGRDIWATWGEIGQVGSPGNDFIVGWYHLKNGQCATPVSGCVCNAEAALFNNCYYGYMFFAKDANGATWSTGDAGTLPTCTTFNAFGERPMVRPASCPAPRAMLNWGEGRYPVSKLSFPGFCSFTFNFLP